MSMPLEEYTEEDIEDKQNGMKARAGNDIRCVLWFKNVLLR